MKYLPIVIITVIALGTLALWFRERFRDERMSSVTTEKVEEKWSEL